jgi:hypothetical protein
VKICCAFMSLSDNRRSDSVVDLELVVLALNQLDEDAFQNVSNWQKQLVDFFINQRKSMTMDEQQQKRKAVHRKTHMRSLQPDDVKWIENIRSEWQLIRNDLAGFDAFKVALDWILQPPKFQYTTVKLLVDANRAPSDHTATEEGYRVDHVVELQVVVAALNRLWDTTYSKIPEWQQQLADFFDRPDNLQSITAEENEQKHLAVSKAIHCPSRQPEEQAWIGLVRDKWTQLRGNLKGFVAFKLMMDSLLQAKDAK